MTGSGGRLADDLARAILRAPLELPTTKWSSRSVAKALGVTQSRVSRAWAPMRRPSRITEELQALGGDCPLSIVGVLLRPEYALLLLEVSRDGGVASSPEGAFLSVAGERSLRGVLAAEFVRDRVPAGSASSTDRFWSGVAARRRPGTDQVAVVSAPVEVGGPVTVLQCAEAEEWLSLFGFLSGTRRHRRPRFVQAADDALRTWFRAGSGDFAWLADELAPVRDPAASLRSGPGPERALADEIVNTIRNAVVEGRFAGGDRITERYLASRLHTSRAQVSAALRLLERDGLLRVAGHAAQIPVPTALDVIETYAARQALGTLVVRAAVRWSPDGRSVVRAALDEVRRHAGAGDVYRTGQADTVFQDLIADVSGLVRIAPVMRLLGDHLRIFLAVLGLDYAYPIGDIVRDDEAIFAAIDAGEADRAAELWRTKMNDARTYMMERLQGGRQLRATTSATRPPTSRPGFSD